MLAVRMPTRQERRRHHRERPAGGGRIPVRHRTGDGPWQPALALDIAAGGAFIIGASWPVGAAIEVAVDVASRTGPLVLAGVVRWATGDGSDDAAAAGAEAAGLTGVGVQFLDVDLDVIIELQAHLARLAAADPGHADDDDPGDVPATD